MEGYAVESTLVIGGIKATAALAVDGVAVAAAVLIPLLHLLSSIGAIIVVNITSNPMPRTL